MENKSTLIKLLISISIAYLILVSVIFMNMGVNSHILHFISTPLLFSLIINISFKTTLLRQIIFIILSSCIYWFALFIAFTNQYWGPQMEFVILGSIIGALLEVILFSWVFRKFEYLKIKHLFLSILIGAFSFGIPYIFLETRPIMYFYAFWYLGVALLMFNIYKAEKK